MVRLLVLSATMLCLATSAYAAGNENFLRLGELKSRGANQVSKAELEVLLPGAKVKNVTPQGGTRYWENEASGKFIASSDLGGSRRGHNPLGGGQGNTANGKWHIGDDGSYCVNLEWRLRTEQWCRYLFKLEDKYYGVKSLEDMAGEAHEFQFSR